MNKHTKWRQKQLSLGKRQINMWLGQDTNMALKAFLTLYGEERLLETLSVALAASPVVTYEEVGIHDG